MAKHGEMVQLYRVKPWDDEMERTYGPKWKNANLASVSFPGVVVALTEEDLRFNKPCFVEKVVMINGNLCVWDPPKEGQ